MADTPKLELVYFPVQAKAEPVRMILKYGKIPYTEKTVQEQFGCSWPKGAKGMAPFGGLPVLLINGEMLAQMPAIARYCAELGGLLPADPLARARCDEVFMAAEELGAVNPCVNVFRGETFVAKKAEYFDPRNFPFKLGNLSKYLGEKPFFTGDAPMYCDFNVWHHLNNSTLLEPDCLSAYPNVVAFMGRVAALPGISEYLAARPVPVDIGSKPMLKPVSAL